MKPTCLVFASIIGVLAIYTVFSFMVYYGLVISSAKNEFGPKELLRKYEWFKDTSAALDKKQADILVYESRLNSMEETYKDVSRRDWPREDREQYNVWVSEVAGIKASYNSLAADYNSQMSKFNWRFTNVGDLPEGATEPLKREYKEYELK